jgi:beta-galactosidase
MNASTDPDPARPAGRLGLESGTLSVEGTPSVLLCSSVFPFRLPPSTWEHRLRLVRESGYRMVDLYVHWGFHEVVEGSIDLTSPERDLTRFLELCDAQGLLVMARPGPYICSETDGGGLPAWLHGDRGGRGPIAVRSTDPEYLAAVDRWYRAVMPVLAAAQTTRGGPVALVQIENEVDFYDCPDAPEYMDHLARAARENGIDVPIIACAGQGDAVAATGRADGVLPTYNLYPDDASAFFEPEVRHYDALTRAQDLPLMVTETNRLHRTLRREILGGARLVAPYLQVGGFDHLVAPSAGNWGDPGSLMTHDYDFGGYVTPDGRRTPEFVEARRLARTLEAWGERLATARPVPLEHLGLRGTGSGGALALDGGGAIVGHAELAGTDTVASVGDTDPLEATLPADSCPFWCTGVPLAPWGREGTLSATAELVGVRTVEDALVLSFAGGSDARIRIDGPPAPDGTPNSAPAWRLHQRGQGAMSVATPEGTIRVEIAVRPDATTEGPVDPEPGFTPAHTTTVGPFDPTAAAGTTRPERFEVVPQTETLRLGAGRLRTEAHVPTGTKQIVLIGAADLVRVAVDGQDRGASIRHGAPIEVAVDPADGHELTLTTEIWGHANFDDARRPALVLGAGRGPGRVLAVRAVQDLSALWEVAEYPSVAGTVRNGSRALRDIGGWSSSRHGGAVEYVRALPAGCGSDVAGGSDPAPLALRLIGLRAPALVQVDDGPTVQLFPGNDTVALPAAPADGAQGPDPSARRGPVIRVRTPHLPDGFCDGAELLWGHEIRDWGAATVQPDALAAALAAHGEEEPADDDTAAVASSQGAGSDLPLRAEPGAPLHARLRATVPSDGAGLLIDLHGSDVEVTVAHHGRPVSRHVLGDVATSGGHPGRAWLPGEWIAAAAAGTGPASAEVRVDLLIEALTPAGGTLEQVQVAAAGS